MKSKAPSYPYLIWMLFFTIIPLGMVVYYAFTDSSGAFTLQSFIDSLYYKDVFIRSLWIAFLSTAICLLIAYPLAYIMSRATQQKRNLLTVLLMLPMWMNFILRIYAWVLLLQNDGLVDIGVKLLGFDVALLGNQGAVVLGMVYNFLPFMVVPLYNSLTKIDNNVINAARDLGANNVQVFTKIIMPLSVPGVISGITMVFVPALTTFVISDILGGSKILLIGNVIEQEFTQSYNWHAGSGLSLVLMIFIVISMALISKYDKDGEGTTF